MDSELRDLREQLRRGQISRREFVARALALGMTASSIGLVLHNAAPSLAAGARRPALSPRRGGTLRAADPGPTPGGLDAATQQDTATIGICHNIYNFLVRLTPKVPQIPYPDLATGWSTTPDGLTWTFPLHKGVKFHSGKPLTAADVLYSLNRSKGPGPGGAPLLPNIARMGGRDPSPGVMQVKAPPRHLP